MTVYLSSFLLISIFGFFCKHTISYDVNSNNNKVKVFLTFTWIVISLVEGLRAYSVGTDTFNYVLDFLYMYLQRHDLGFQLLMRVVHFFSSSPTVLLLVCALLTNGLYLIAIYRLSSDCYYSVFAFFALMFYFTSFNAIRQSIAVSFVLNAYAFIKDKNIKMYFILMIIAISFHSSAIIGFLYVLVYQNLKNVEGDTKQIEFRRDFLELVIVGIVSVVSCVFLESGMLLFARFVPKYAKYIYSQYATMTGGIQLPIVYTAIFLSFVAFTYRDQEKRTISIPLGFAVAFSFIHIRISYILRFMWYFDIVAIIALPYMFTKGRIDKKTAIIFKLLVSIILVLYMFYNLLNGYMCVTDYSFFWQ